MRLALGLVTALVLVAPSSLGLALPPPVTPEASNRISDFASPHELAFNGVDGLTESSGRIAHEAGGVVYWVRDQMRAVLVHLLRAEFLPMRSNESIAQAVQTWEIAQGSYHAPPGYYDISLATPSICLNLEANAWALLAANELANATGRTDVRTRAGQIASSLANAIQSGSVGGVPRCPAGAELRPVDWPMPLWALLLYAEETRDLQLQNVGLNALDSQIASGWQGAFQDDSGVFPAIANAQYLLALDVAARLAPQRYEARLSELSEFVQGNLLRADDRALRLDSVTRVGSAYQPLPGAVDLVAQAWGAYALNAVRQREPLGVERAPERVLEGLVARSTGGRPTAFVNDAGITSAELNLMVALATVGPAVVETESEGARISIVVPSESHFDYPRPGTLGDASYLISNEMVTRFVLEPVGPPTQPILMPLERLGGLPQPYAVSPYSPQPTLLRVGSPVPVQAVSQDLLRFVGDASVGSNYRLSIYVPVFPASADFARELRVFFRVNASQSVSVDQLRLELDATAISVAAVRVNDQLLPATSYTATEVAPAEYLPKSHMRIDIRGITLRPSQPTEILVEYEDTQPPVLAEPFLTEDAEGLRPLRYDEEQDRYLASSGRPGYVHVVATDNGVLRSVNLAVGAGPDASAIRLGRHAQRADTFTAPLPAISAGAAATFHVFAVDEHDTFNRTREFVVEAQPGFLREGNLVLLVFTTTLLLGALSIFLKMGRKRA